MVIWPPEVAQTREREGEGRGREKGEGKERCREIKRKKVERKR